MMIGKNGRKPKEINEELASIREKEGLYSIDDTLFECVISHAAIELLSDPTIYNRSILAEYHGHLNGIDAYLDCIRGFIKTSLHNANPNQKYNLTMKETDFCGVSNLFFDRCEINMELSVGDWTNFPPVGSSNVDWTENGDSFVAINVVGSCGDINGLSYYTASTVAHELTHAYEDICRHENKAPSIIEKGKLCNYDKIVDLVNFRYLNGGENIKKYGVENVYEVEKLGGFLYFCHKPEMNALISEAYAEMDQYEGTLKTLSQAFELLKKTDCWRILTLKKLYVEDIKDINNTRLQELLIEKLNSVLKRNDGKNKKQLITNYQQFIKCINDMWMKVFKKYDVKLGKICYDVFLEKNDTEIKGGYQVGRMIK